MNQLVGLGLDLFFFLFSRDCVIFGRSGSSKRSSCRLRQTQDLPPASKQRETVAGETPLKSRPAFDQRGRCKRTVEMRKGKGKERGKERAEKVGSLLPFSNPLSPLRPPTALGILSNSSHGFIFRPTFAIVSEWALSHLLV